MDDGPKMKGGGRGGRGGGGGGRGGAPGRGPLLLGPSRGEQNDYCQHFVDTGQRPQNFLRDVDMVCSCWSGTACPGRLCTVGLKVQGRPGAVTVAPLSPGLQA